MITQPTVDDGNCPDEYQMHGLNITTHDLHHFLPPQRVTFFVTNCSLITTTPPCGQPLAVPHQAHFIYYV